MSAAGVIIGAPGAGKTAVLERLTTTLESEGVRHGTLETEQLSLGFPLLDASSWIAQLKVVLELQREAGRELFLLAATVETPEELQRLRGALGVDRLLVACLRAPAEALEARLERREPDGWPGKPALIAKARRLAAAVPRFPGVDLVIDTDGADAGGVASLLRDEMAARGLLAERL